MERSTTLNKILKKAGAPVPGFPYLRVNRFFVSFCLNSKDYVTGRLPERYRMHINSRVWLPDRFERFDTAGVPQEFTFFKNCRINPNLDGAFFDSGYRDPSAGAPAEPLRP